MVARSVALGENFLTPARDRMIQALAAARLVGIDNAEDGATLRVAHQALLTHWPRAEQLLKTQRAALSLREKLEAEAQEWEARASDPSYYLQAGQALILAETMVSDNRIDLSQRAHAFILASGQAAQTASNRANKRVKITIGISLALAFVMLMLSALSFDLWVNLGRINLYHKVLNTPMSCFNFDGYLDFHTDRVEIEGDMTPPVKSKIQGIPYSCISRFGGMATRFTITGTLTNPIFSVGQTEFKHRIQ